MQIKNMKTNRLSQVLVIFFASLFATPILAVTEVSSSSNNQIKAGQRDFNQGRYEEALAAWNIALDGFRLSADKNGQARVLRYKAEAYLAVGQNYKAINSLKHALELAEATANKALANQIAGSLGTAYMLSSRTDEAQALFTKTIEQQQAAGELNSAAVAGNNLGNLHASKADAGAAISAYRQAISDAKAAGNNELVAKGTVNIARAMLDSQDNANARKQLELVSSQAEALSDSHQKAYVLISIGRLYSKLVDADKFAEDALNSAVRTAKNIGDQRAASYAYGYLGEFNEQKNNIDDAMEYARKASRFLSGIQAPDISYRWKWLEGRLLKAQGHNDQAINAYQHAVDDLQKIRHILATAQTGSKTDFKHEAGQLYMALADLLLKNSESLTDQNKLNAELRKVRTTIEMLKSAELENYFRDDCVAALKKKTKGIDRLDERTAAIYPIVFPDRLEILLSLPNGMKRFTVAVTEDKLNKEINRFREHLEKRTTHQYKRNAIKIYNWLVQPLEKDLQAQQVDTLVFIPDGSLRTIPLTALYSVVI